ncbi:MAG: glutathione S-transferase [Neomegalonema sp.]|nr:glutathione S-transferase [Neomegalonema sp.]
MSYTLFLGSKRYSSWSLRGWLLMAPFGLEFKERVAELRSADFATMSAEMAPARTVPTLAHAVDGQQRIIWDSLAIAEYLAEQHPDLSYWPADAGARAWARSIVAEAHSSFGPLRQAMPMNLGRRYSNKSLAAPLQDDVARLTELWETTRARFGGGGPYLFGADYGVAEAFFTPYATRLETYGVSLQGDAAAYSEALLSHPSYLQWKRAGLDEPAAWIAERYEMSDQPETLG